MATRNSDVADERMQHPPSPYRYPASAEPPMVTARPRRISLDEPITVIKPIPEGSSFFIFSHTNRLAIFDIDPTNPRFFFLFLFFHFNFNRSLMPSLLLHCCDITATFFSIKFLLVHILRPPYLSLTSRAPRKFLQMTGNIIPSRRGLG